MTLQSPWLLILLALLAFAALGGGWAAPRYGHTRAWSPAVVILVVLLVLLVTGNLRLH